MINLDITPTRLLIGMRFNYRQFSLLAKSAELYDRLLHYPGDRLFEANYFDRVGFDASTKQITHLEGEKKGSRIEINSDNIIISETIYNSDITKSITSLSKTSFQISKILNDNILLNYYNRIGCMLYFDGFSAVDNATKAISKNRLDMGIEGTAENLSFKLNFKKRPAQTLPGKNGKETHRNLIFQISDNKDEYSNLPNEYKSKISLSIDAQIYYDESDLANYNTIDKSFKFLKKCYNEDFPKFLNFFEIGETR